MSLPGPAIVVFLRFVVRLRVSVEVLLPAGGVVVLALVSALVVQSSSLVVTSRPVVVARVLVVVALGVVHGHSLNLVVLVLVVVAVRATDLLWVGVVVSSLGDNIVVFGPRHSEVHRLVLLVLVVVGVVLVAVGVLRGHVVVRGVLVVVRLGVGRSVHGVLTLVVH